MLSPIFSTLYNIRNVFQSDTRVSNSFRTKRSLLGLTFPRESTLKVWRKNCQISILLFILFIPRVTRLDRLKWTRKRWRILGSHNRNSCISYNTIRWSIFPCRNTTPSRPRVRSHPCSSSIKYELVIRQVSSTSSTREINYWVKADRIPPLPLSFCATRYNRDRQRIQVNYRPR